MKFSIPNDNVLANYDRETRRGSDQMAAFASAFARLGSEAEGFTQDFCLYEDGWGVPALRTAGAADAALDKWLRSHP